MALISFEDGVVRLGDAELPGVMTDMSIAGSFRSDDKMQDQLSGTVRTPLGWDDADIRLNMDLTTESNGKNCYEKLEIIDRIFKATDEKGNPQIYQIVNRHVLARGVHRVSFEKLISVENDQNDTIKVILEFREFIPPIVQFEINAARNNDGTGTSAPTVNITEPEADADIFSG